MENAGCVGVEVVRAPVPLRDLPPADSFGTTARAARTERMSLSAPFGGSDFSPEADVDYEFKEPAAAAAGQG